MAENFNVQINGDLHVTGQVTAGALPDGKWYAPFVGPAGIPVGTMVAADTTQGLQKTITIPGDGLPFIGVVHEVLPDGTYIVQLGGLATVSYTGSISRNGLMDMSANGTGGIRLVTAGGQRLFVYETDPENKKATLLLRGW